MTSRCEILPGVRRGIYTPMQRWATKVRLPTEWKEEACWEWMGCLDACGYGRFKIDGKMVAAHRYAYERFIGPIPEGLDIDHLCRNPSCVNPDHLEAVSHRENVLRGSGITAKHATKTHCPSGHPYTGENLRLYQGRRYCRECHRLQYQYTIPVDTPSVEWGEGQTEYPPEAV